MSGLDSRLEELIDGIRHLVVDTALLRVALEAGFAHQSQMARWMRRVLGVTPTSLTRDSCAQ